MRSDRWTAVATTASPQNRRIVQNGGGTYVPNSYNTVQDHRFHPDYEDPSEYYYEKPPEPASNSLHRLSHSSTGTSNGSPPPLPPMNQNTLQRLYYSQKESPSTHSSGSRRRRYLWIALLTVLLLMIICSVAVFLWHKQQKDPIGKERKSSVPFTERISDDKDVLAANVSERRRPQRFVDPLISASSLLTLLITQRKICIFEVSTSEAEVSRQDFQGGHIQTARLLFFGNLSHSGVPVHPLQFQRYVRNLAVDTDCHIIVYDRGQQIWAAYAYWIFQVYGHERTSLLNGGYGEWKRLADEGAGPYAIDYGHGSYADKIGNFRAEWESEYICTFDDVLANFDNRDYDIVDAQNNDEYEGHAYGAVFGHIRTAINIPIESVYDFTNNTWHSMEEHKELFHRVGLSSTRPVILYDGTSLRSSVIWFALYRLQYAATIYFGSWPEWIIRAPDYLKVIPDS